MLGLARELLRWPQVKKALVALTAIAIGLPLGHVAYDAYEAPDPPFGSAEWQMRADALARAQVFLPPELKAPDPQPFGDELTCHYAPKRTTGTTPKFDCRLPSGEVVKVKYGVTPEIPGEVAAMKLLALLGFGADRMSIVRRVRCHGCPRSPYRSRQVAQWFFVAGLLDQFLDYNQYADFANASVERRFEARSFEIGEHEGWAWYELKDVDPARGGATRAELDAFRLTAMLLAHWDNKPTNQRLVCLGEQGPGSAAPCARPLLMIQDAGATFGPRKVDYLAWKHSRIWRDAEGCAVSMSLLPFRGATFQDVEITEEGRRLLAAKLEALTSAQLEELFRSSHFPDAETGGIGSSNVQPWVQVFRAKVAEITSRACAPSPSR